MKRVNLLAGFPFSDNSFDTVYSSHVLEHFASQRGSSLIRESYRVLKPGGILRTVVPDLEASCREYLRILAISDSDPAKTTCYDWIKIELLDQLVRTSGGGEMGPLMRSFASRSDRTMIEYVQSRIESDLVTSQPPEGATSRLASVSSDKVMTKLTYMYLRLVRGPVPKDLRPMVWNGTSIGEKHRWMYDRYGLTLLMKDCGFAETRFVEFNDSSIPGFCEDRLDSNPDESEFCIRVLERKAKCR